MYEIAIANEQTVLEIDEEFLRTAAWTALDAEEVRAASISIALVDDAALRTLNARHLGHDYDTDVLSFLLECEEDACEDDAAASSSDADRNVPRGRGKRIEGEVIVSAEMAAHMARQYRWSPAHELALYVVHGLLHLAGYDDLTDDERELMRARERAVLSRLDIVPPRDA